MSPLEPISEGEMGLEDAPSKIILTLILLYTFGLPEFVRY